MLKKVVIACTLAATLSLNAILPTTQAFAASSTEVSNPVVSSTVAATATVAASTGEVEI